MKRTVKMISVAVGLAVAVSASSAMLSACTGGGRSNETTPLVMSSDALDTVFNPFFYTSGPDGEVVGQTQVGLLTSDENGQIVAGEDEPCVALEYSVVTTGTSDDKGTEGSADEYARYYTDYHIAIKNGLTFSDGEPLTIKDVLFNMYVYLDPVYSGSSTMYSVDIQGLRAYRTQSTDSAEQEGFDAEFNRLAQERIDALLLWADDDNSTWADLSPEEQADVLKVEELFREELATDWTSSMSADLEEYEKYNNNREGFKFEYAWQVFLFNYRVITATTLKDAQGNRYYRIDNNLPPTTATTQEALTEYVFQTMLAGRESATDSYKTGLATVIQYYATANTFRQYLVSDEISKRFEGNLVIRTVSGITVDRGTSIPSANGTIDLGEECDILHIRINGEDPKAIQNFSFAVAPMHYYSSHANEFSLEAGSEYFGVEFANSEFMTSIRTNQVPRGAGPYRVTTPNGSTETDRLSKGQMFSDNMVYFERNEHFMLGAPKIKYLRYKVISTSLLYESIKAGEVDYGSPTATGDMMTSLNGSDSAVVSYKTTDNLGYGYIGINARFVTSLEVRKAIMYAMDTSLVMDYYQDPALASLIYRPMSKTLKLYYPTNATAYYPYSSNADEREETIRLLLEEAGYEYNSSSGFYESVETGERLKFTFTIAGETDDHPAMNTLQNAATILNDIGFDITVTRDSTALSKLANGQLEVWAAAWSSSSDPDMYQVYHKDSSATSILAWGFPTIEVDGSSTEKEILDELAYRIEQGRETTDVAKRYEYYSGMSGPATGGLRLDDGGNIENMCALDLVMELAVELPTYQRSALYVWRNGLFDEATLALFEQSTAYQSPLSKIWLVSFDEA